MNQNLTSEQKNQVISHAFASVEPMLARYDGAAVARVMDGLWDEDRGTWNGVYWKIEKWLRDFFARRDHTLRDGGEDHSGAALVEFIRSCYPDRLDGNFGASELPFIMQRLKAKYGTPDKTAPDARRWPERDDLGSDVPF